MIPDPQICEWAQGYANGELMLRFDVYVDGTPLGVLPDPESRIVAVAHDIAVSRVVKCIESAGPDFSELGVLTQIALQGLSGTEPHPEGPREGILVDLRGKKPRRHNIRAGLSRA
ncbi:hypothetical protein RE9425_03480 [Prescottella equi]|nr:hypothetical protein RE9425_03480 [Prescottella equi]